MDHKPLDDPVERQVVVVAVPAVRGEVLDGLGGVLREEAQGDVSRCRPQDGARGQGQIFFFSDAGAGAFSGKASQT